MTNLPYLLSVTIGKPSMRNGVAGKSFAAHKGADRIDGSCVAHLLGRDAHGPDFQIVLAHNARVSPAQSNLLPPALPRLVAAV
jgi:hypothetical protein